jgi:hypothetical protein
MPLLISFRGPHVDDPDLDAVVYAGESCGLKLPGAVFIEIVDIGDKRQLRFNGRSDLPGDFQETPAT